MFKGIFHPSICKKELQHGISKLHSPACYNIITKICNNTVSKMMLHAAETTDTSIIIGVIMISYVCILAYIYSVYKVDRSFVAGVFVCLFCFPLKQHQKSGVNTVCCPWS